MGLVGPLEILIVAAILVGIIVLIGRNFDLRVKSEDRQVALCNAGPLHRQHLSNTDWNKSGNKSGGNLSVARRSAPHPFRTQSLCFSGR
jgi:hypothetical protein